jgi:hypothetical protein
MDIDIISIEHENCAKMYTSAFKLIKDTELQSFQFNKSPQILACKSTLITWNIEENTVYNACNQTGDIIEYHIVKCKETLELWTRLLNLWKSTIKQALPSAYMILS